MTKDLTRNQMYEIILEMRKTYQSGQNAMAFARKKINEMNEIAGGEGNFILCTLVAYDLQTGTYVQNARLNIASNHKWCNQLSNLISPLLPPDGTLLEVGLGEATTLAGVLDCLGEKVRQAIGFDISWSRVNEGNLWLKERNQNATLFVGDLFHIPLANNSIDVVYSSHSLEPNGGAEIELLTGCLRVARHAVVLVEPIYELATADAQERMKSHGYVTGLKNAAEKLGAEIIDYRLLEYSVNPLNPSGVLTLLKKNEGEKKSCSHKVGFICPLTGANLVMNEDVCFAQDVGIAYPVLRGVPLLRAEHAVIASTIEPS